MTIKEALDAVDKILPEKIPQPLVEACKCEPVDPMWPIKDPLEAIRYLMAWERYDGQELHSLDEITHRLTHSHYYEQEDLKKYGVEQVYQKSLSTKFVSIAWFLCGRYGQDIGLIAELDRLGWPPLRFIDFGGAPWLQAIFYRRKGLKVTVVNQTKDSDCHRFGRFLAACYGIDDIREYSAEEAWDATEYDVIYCCDVLEHIPPLADGSPGWVPIAERLINALVPKGLAYLNAPLEIAEGPPRPVEHHPVHYTSPFSLGSLLETKGVWQEGYFLRKSG